MRAVQTVTTPANAERSDVHEAEVRPVQELNLDDLLKVAGGGSGETPLFTASSVSGPKGNW